MPFDILAQVEGIGIGILVVFPAFRQRGYDLVFRIVRRKAGEDQGIDLAMLIQGGVDAGIVAAGVYQGIGLRGARAAGAG